MNDDTGADICTITESDVNALTAAAQTASASRITQPLLLGYIGVQTSDGRVNFEPRRRLRHVNGVPNGYSGLLPGKEARQNVDANGNDSGENGDDDGTKTSPNTTTEAPFDLEGTEGIEMDEVVVLGWQRWQRELRSIV
ncbi:hypothetical protein N7478_009166 [Penicillium angulare]|uniref:uncharacterized protein n=1 Tax=Penicillium angulare TaxID=116970 RepID=UPI002541BC08|nr:uncharacterized protein N7478_009166 [Penicillium angulare]KAJ5274041.1 hypothetical protein N7478_009166 [Penicillium angulare]